jgi:hypothetical protein
MVTSLSLLIVTNHAIQRRRIKSIVLMPLLSLARYAQPSRCVSDMLLPIGVVIARSVLSRSTALVYTGFDVDYQQRRL